MLARVWAQRGAATGLGLVGVGPVDSRFPTLTAMAADAGAPGVEHLGWLLPDELGWLYEHAEMLLVPSYYEGFGFPILEAFVAGLPVLASDIPVFREVGTQAAAFADPHDASAWAAEIARIAGDPATRERMRGTGRARAAELTYRATATATLSLLREVARIPG
jgi:glycosyltransferase involved in cell wall biosynthesis